MFSLLIIQPEPRAERANVTFPVFPQMGYEAYNRIPVTSRMLRRVLTELADQPVLVADRAIFFVRLGRRAKRSLSVAVAGCRVCRYYVDSILWLRVP